MIEELREVKDEEEYHHYQKACNIADMAYHLHPEK